MGTPSYESLLPIREELPILKQIEDMAHKAAYDLLVELNSRATKDKWLQICTSESLTAGMIMSTLVDIPWGGYLKYGAFGVYDTDAKRVFNKVSVDNVYTHRCAKEMAIGILKNSNASLAIAVTGNAMPLNDHVDMLGEVFIGVAGYKTDSANGTTKIIYKTTSINACSNGIIDFEKTCQAWYDTISKLHTYNPRDRTAVVSREIRNFTTATALNFCLEFVKENDPEVPNFILERKKTNEIMNHDRTHTTIPENKFNNILKDECVNDCHDTDSPDRTNTATYPEKVLHANSANKSRRNRRYTRRMLRR
jgi:nicotinamide mononucleotide (NMN) deamidase PncC